MNRRFLVTGLVLALIVGMAFAQQPAAPKTSLKVGEMAPDFTLNDQNGKPVKLSDFRGKQNVVLAFYTLAFTGGWTREVQNYRDNMAKFRELNTQVLGISVDSVPAQKEFAKQNAVEFPLLSDFKRDVSRSYGVLDEERGFAIRTTFVVDKEGKVKSIEQGKTAVDVTGAISSCETLK